MSRISTLFATLRPSHRPWVTPQIGWHWLSLAAILCIVIWQAAEHVVRRLPFPQQSQFLLAAETANRAQREIARVKEQLGLLQSASLDPNRTGLIGPDWSEIATTIGDLSAKRTVTNPDLAAVIARILLTHRAARGGSVGLVLSGSFVGANVAAIAAVEALGFRPVIISSVGASMYGATDPDFTWLDMETAVSRAGIWKARSMAAVFGGESALANSLSNTGREMLLIAARRNGLEPLVGADFRELKESIHQLFARAAPHGLVALISAGGAVLSIGTCADAYRIRSGIVQGKPPCQDGEPGLIHDFAARGVPVLHILNIKRFVLEWGLPYDPVPLPTIGQNVRAYGRVALP